MDENKELVQEINVRMANEEKAKKRSDTLTTEFQAIEKADIMIRNDMKHNINKVHKGEENIQTL